MGATLARWNLAPGRVLWAWTAVAAAITAALLLAVWIIARASTPDPTPMILPGLTRPATFADALQVFGRLTALVEVYVSPHVVLSLRSLHFV